MHLIADNAAGHLMKAGKVDVVLYGADRVAANGDVANKIGSYKLAVVARENGIPCYSVVPTSTIDLNLPTGDLIPIEKAGPAREVTHVGETQIAPDNVPVYNPAFDVTPHRYLTGIITEEGICYPPFTLRPAAPPRNGLKPASASSGWPAATPVKESSAMSISPKPMSSVGVFCGASNGDQSHYGAAAEKIWDGRWSHKLRSRLRRRQYRPDGNSGPVGHPVWRQRAGHHPLCADQQRWPARPWRSDTRQHHKPAQGADGRNPMPSWRYPAASAPWTNCSR